MKKISIIVPVYNAEEYLHRCVDSILSQSFSDFELILVDDGSPDNCGAICDEYAAIDNRVRVIHQKNGGVSRARNAGLDIAEGQYIAFCDSDDYIEKNWLEGLLSSLTVNSAELVFSDYRYTNIYGAVEKIRRHHKGVFTFKSEHERLSFLVLELLGGKVGWEVWAKLFVKSIIEDNHIRFCETCENYGEDLGFVLEYMLYVDRLVVSDNSGYYYVQHKSSAVATNLLIVKLNAMNEVSKSVKPRFLSIVPGKDGRKAFAVIHFCIMRNQYDKIVLKENYPCLGQEIRKIKDIKYYKRNTADLFGAYSLLKRWYGNRIAKQYLLLSLYCIHENWIIHGIISFLFYRYIIRST